VHLPVPVKVELASRPMPLSAILQLTEGSIIDFQKSVDEELLLVVANRCIGCGRAVKVGENFGLHVTRIGNLKQRLEAVSG
jgi:flagellar motor switch protein FliN/FliY